VSENLKKAFQDQHFFFSK
jgi:hypothetical protein